MFAKPWWLLLPCLMGCAGTSRRWGETDDYGYIRDTRQVWTRGPWDAITPSRDVDEVIDQLCPAIMELPGARDRDHGREYCGAIYSLGAGLYYASMPSPLTDLLLLTSAKKKSCIPPSEVKDARSRVAPILAAFHSHPWAPSEMSPVDLQAKSYLWYLRIQFDTACHIQKLIPYAHDDRPGELYERQGKTWKLIAYIKVEDKSTGRLTSVTD